MRTILCLVFFGLIAQMTTAQDMLEVNSPTSINLNTLISVPSEDGVGAPTIYVFGDAGLGYVSKDKCKSWKQLDIDPVKKRNINLVNRVNDTLLFVSGGAENDLLKYSTDDGVTFKDFILPEASRQFPVAAIIPMNNWEYSVVAFLQSNFFNLWQNYPGTGSGWIVQAGVSIRDLPFAYLGGSAEDGYVTTWGRTIWSGTNGDFPVFGIMMIHFKDPPLGYKFDLYPGEVMYDSITSVSPSCKGVNLTTFYTEDEYKDKDTQKGYHTYEGVLSPMVDAAFTNYRPFPELGKEMSIKSSLITRPHSLFWHVGGDNAGQNGFIIKDGIIIKRVQSSALNMIIDVSDNEVDAILAVGNNGKIYSTRTDLALATSDPVISWTKADDFSAYPNPFNSELTVKSSSEVLATLSDVLGTTLKQIRLESGTNLISLVGLKPGIYFLTNKKQTLKLIKQ